MSFTGTEFLPTRQLVGLSTEVMPSMADSGNPEEYISSQYTQKQLLPDGIVQNCDTFCQTNINSSNAQQSVLSRCDLNSLSPVNSASVSYLPLYDETQRTISYKPLEETSNCLGFDNPQSVQMTFPNSNQYASPTLNKYGHLIIASQPNNKQPPQHSLYDTRASSTTEHMPITVIPNYSGNSSLPKRTISYTSVWESTDMTPAPPPPPRRIFSPAVVARPANAPLTTEDKGDAFELGNKSVFTRCPHCGNMQHTATDRQIGFTNVVASILACICLPFTWLVCCHCLPMFVNDWKDVVHYCGICGRKIGSFNPIETNSTKT